MINYIKKFIIFFMKITQIFIILILTIIFSIGLNFPQVPEAPTCKNIRSRDLLLKCLQKIHEYHSIVGRWRL